MRFTPDVDVPDELVTAAAAGTLALFVGAGVSLNAPSNLPLFDGLADKLAELNGETYDRAEPADAFLGRLIDREPDVREQAKRIIGSSMSSPNANHAAIVKLVHHAATTRLVTTNFDEHLTNAAAAAGIDLGDRFNGPAVPLARDFSGLVHLHGTVSRPATELVLTDGDFGRAYLTDGWARRFVQELFLDRVVLFVGYSHEDTVMKYLARGLPPTTSRYVLTDAPDSSKWTDLRITPVAYPAANDHAALTGALEAWAGRLALGQLDYSARVKSIVTGGPPKTPVEADFIREAITGPVGVRAFAKTADGKEWLQWAEEQNLFTNMFKPGSLEADSSRVLAWWFADTYTRDDVAIELALGTIARHGPVASWDLMRALATNADRLSQPNRVLSGKLSIIVAAALRTEQVPPEQGWLSFYGMPLDSATVMPFLRRAVQPRLVLAESRSWFALDDSEELPAVTATIAWTSSEDEVRLLLDAARSDFESIAADVLHTFEQAVRDGYELLHRFAPDTTWDSWSFGRDSIESGADEDMREFESALIDGLRDASVVVGADDHGLSPRWLSDRFPLFRRLGVHALAEDGHRSADEKADLLLARVSLYDHHIHHELFRILSMIVPALGVSSRQRLLEQALVGPTGFDPVDEASFHRRVTFRLLEWLTRFVTDWPELTAAVDSIRAQEPGISPIANPDLQRTTVFTSWGGKLPYEVDDFVELIGAAGAASAMGDLLARDYNERTFEEPDWDDALSLIRQVVEKRPSFGVDLLAEAKGDRCSDITTAIVRGWASSDLDDAQLAAATDAVDALVDDKTQIRVVAEFVLGAVDRKVDARAVEQLQRLDRIAEHLWDQNAEDVEQELSDDWTFIGLNSWPGFIAQYWINRVRLRWRANQPHWAGLSGTERGALSAMLGTRSAAGRGPFSVITGELPFLYAADSGYTIERVFPRFDRTVEDRAAQAWTSLLHHPRIDDRMLDDGFWALLVAAAPLVQDAARNGIASRYWHLLSLATLQATAAVVDRPALIASLAASGDNALAKFFDALARNVKELEPDAIQQVWGSWLREIYAERARFGSGSLSMAERTALGDLALRMGPALTEALTLTSGIPGPLGVRTTLRSLPEEALAGNADLIAEILTLRIRAGTTPDYGVTSDLEKVVGRLKAVGANPGLLRDLAEAAIGIGIFSADEWLGN